MSDDQPESFAVVVGRNCKRIRTEIGLRQDGLAVIARSVGLKWNAGKVSDFEAGRSTPSFETVLCVSLALQLAAYGAGKALNVRLADLVGDVGMVTLNPEVTVEGSALAQICSGASWAALAKPTDSLTGIEGLLARSGLAEDRLAKRLDIPRDVLATICWELWKQSFAEERDDRAGLDSSPQKRGQIARQLQGEIERRLGIGDDQ